jgi:hypothetical protein
MDTSQRKVTVDSLSRANGSLESDLKIMLDYFENIDIGFAHDPECDWRNSKCWCQIREIKKVMRRRGRKIT